jgi:hypothetical protein
MQLSCFVLAITAVLFGTKLQAAPIVSGTFSIGQGYILTGSGPVTGTWNNSETVGANTDVTGPFTLSVSLASDIFSGTGPSFPGRVLTTQGVASEASGFSGDFLATVTANYTDAGVGTTTLVIESISIYAFNHSNFTNTDEAGTDEISWSESTIGNLGSSAALDLGAPSSSLGTASDYTQLTWNPGEVGVAGTSSIRTFLLSLNGGDFGAVGAAIDGFEVTGHIVFTPIPEPSTAMLACAAMVGMATLVRRNRRRS